MEMTTSAERIAFLLFSTSRISNWMALPFPIASSRAAANETSPTVMDQLNFRLSSSRYEIREEEDRPAHNTKIEETIITRDESGLQFILNFGFNLSQIGFLHYLSHPTHIDDERVHLL